MLGRRTVAAAFLTLVYLAFALPWWFSCDAAYGELVAARALIAGGAGTASLTTGLPMLAVLPLDAVGLDPTDALCSVGIVAGAALGLRVLSTLRTLDLGPGLAELCTLLLVTAPTYTMWATGGLVDMVIALLSFVVFAELALGAERALARASVAAIALALLVPWGGLWAATLAVLAGLGRALDARRADAALPVPARRVPGRVLRPALAVAAVAALTGIAVAGLVARPSPWTFAPATGVRFLLTWIVNTWVWLLALPGLLVWGHRSGLGGSAGAAAALWVGAVVLTGGDELPMGRQLLPVLPLLTLQVASLADFVARRAGFAWAATLTVLVAAVGWLPTTGMPLVIRPVRAALHYRSIEDRSRTEVQVWQLERRTVHRALHVGAALGDIASPGDVWAPDGAPAASAWASGLAVIEAMGGPQGQAIHPGVLRHREPDWAMGRIVTDAEAARSEVQDWRVRPRLQARYRPELHQVGSGRLVVLHKTSGRPARVWRRMLQQDATTDGGRDRE